MLTPVISPFPMMFSKAFSHRFVKSRDCLVKKQKFADIESNILGSAVLIGVISWYLLLSKSQFLTVFMTEFETWKTMISDESFGINMEDKTLHVTNIAVNFAAKMYAEVCNLTGSDVRMPENAVCCLFCFVFQFFFLLLLLLLLCYVKTIFKLGTAYRYLHSAKLLSGHFFSL